MTERYHAHPVIAMEVFRHRVRHGPVSFIACEAAVLVGAVVAAAHVRMTEAAWMATSWLGLLAKAGLVGGTTQVCLYYAELYDLRVVADRRELLVRLVKALGATSLLLGAVYFWAPPLIVGRGVFAIAAAGIVVVVSSWRLSFEWVTRRPGPRERLLLIGTSGSAVALTREWSEQRELGLEIVGFIDPDPARIGMPVINPGVIGTIDDVPRIIRERRVDRVVVSLADARGHLPVAKLLAQRIYTSLETTLAENALSPRCAVEAAASSDPAAKRELGRRPRVSLRDALVRSLGSPDTDLNR